MRHICIIFNTYINRSFAIIIGKPTSTPMADRSVEAAGTDVNSTPSSQVSDGPEVQISTSLQQMTPSLDLLFSNLSYPCSVSI